MLRPSDEQVTYIRVEDIAMDKNVLVVEADLEGAEARLLKDGSNGVVRIRADIPEPGRKRFAASHELGHWQIHEGGTCVCTAADMADYQRSFREVEANAFAAELLMPTFLFRPPCEHKAPSLDLVGDLKRNFNTSLTSTALRPMDECAEDRMVVLSKNRVVERCRRSEKCKLPLFIEYGSPLHQESVAFHCEPNPPCIPRADKVPLHARFDSDQFRYPEPENLVVWEQSMRLGSYPTVLTLLWVVER
jgi:hypothetical protein